MIGVIRRVGTPVGDVLIGDFDGSICLCDWCASPKLSRNIMRIELETGRRFHQGTSAVIDEAVTQLGEYFDGKRIAFDLPLIFIGGTEFRKLVWKKLLEVDYGTTVSYSQLAASLDKPSAARAVASAVGFNHISIFVPCHRIVGADGNLRGFAGGLRVKETLLRLENEHSAP